MLDRLGRCLNLFVLTEGPSSHEFVSVRPSNFVTRKTPTNSRKPCRPRECLFEWTSDRSRLIASDPSKRGGNCITVGRQRPIEHRLPERRQLRGIARRQIELERRKSNKSVITVAKNRPTFTAVAREMRMIPRR